MEPPVYVAFSCSKNLQLSRLQSNRSKEITTEILAKAQRFHPTSLIFSIMNKGNHYTDMHMLLNHTTWNKTASSTTFSYINAMNHLFHIHVFNQLEYFVYHQLLTTYFTWLQSEKVHRFMSNAFFILREDLWAMLFSMIILNTKSDECTHVQFLRNNKLVLCL